MKLLFFFVFYCIFCVFSFAQSVDIFTHVQNNSGEGKVVVHQDSLIHNLVNKYIEFCQTAKGFSGYRIRLCSFSGNSAREQATSLQTKFEKEYPDYTGYLVYNNPNFEVLAGDFRAKSDAIKLLKTISSEYHSAFIVKTLITFPK